MRVLAREARLRGWVPIGLELLARLTPDGRASPGERWTDRSLVVFVETGGLSGEAVVALLWLAGRDTRPHIVVRLVIADRAGTAGGLAVPARSPSSMSDRRAVSATPLGAAAATCRTKPAHDGRPAAGGHRATGASRASTSRHSLAADRSLRGSGAHGRRGRRAPGLRIAALERRLASARAAQASGNSEQRPNGNEGVGDGGRPGRTCCGCARTSRTSRPRWRASAPFSGTGCRRHPWRLWRVEGRRLACSRASARNWPAWIWRCEPMDAGSPSPPTSRRARSSRHARASCG